MARRHYLKINKIPQYWGKFQFEIDLTLATTLNLGIFSTTSNYSGSFNKKTSILIDWGDGNVEMKDILSTNTLHSHLYLLKKKYIITIDEIFTPTDLDKQARVTGVLFNSLVFDSLSKMIIYRSDAITSLNQIFNSRKKFNSFGDNFKFETPNVLTTSGTFYGCTGLTYLPEGIFDELVNVTSYYYLCPSCTNLKTIPKGIFKNSKKCTNYSQIFSYCNNLNSNIEDIFDGAILDKVTTVNNAFQDCKLLTGYAQPVINKFPTTVTKSSTFKNCLALSDYATIPVAWK